jgi:hypothetical protein
MEINTLRELKEIYNSDDSVKWLLLSTGGYHGTYLTLDDVESIIRGESEFSEDVNGKYWITILLIFPGKVTHNEFNIRWGDIALDLSDVQFLREAVRDSLRQIQESQEGNV